MPQDRSWILFCYDVAISYLKFTCGEPPAGSELGVMWHEHDLGEYPSAGIYSEFDPPWDYVHRCEAALEQLNAAVSWSDIQPREEEDEELCEDDVGVSGEVLDTEPTGRLLSCDVSVEEARYFDESSKSKSGSPTAVILMGGSAVGKTTVRKQRFATGYVLIDAGDIFLGLSRGEVLPFPGGLETPMNVIGSLVAERALSERRNIVTEIIGAVYEPTTQLIDAIKAVGYKVEIISVTCDFEESLRRNANREGDTISAYYAEEFQRTWIIEACRQIAAAQPGAAGDAPQAARP